MPCRSRRPRGQCEPSFQDMSSLLPESKRRHLTPPSSGRSKGRFAPFGPPLMSNVRCLRPKVHGCMAAHTSDTEPTSFAHERQQESVLRGGRLRRRAMLQRTNCCPGRPSVGGRLSAGAARQEEQGSSRPSRKHRSARAHGSSRVAMRWLARSTRCAFEIPVLLVHALSSKLWQ